MPETILELQNLKTHFPITKGVLLKRNVGTVKAVDGVNLKVMQGEVLGLVGESGCGKSTLARTVMQLVPTTGGTVILEGKNLTTSSTAEVLDMRRDLQMDVAKHVAELMETVGLASRFMQKYPHEFSGGQRQRIAIARALALRPKVVLADEPVSALDVSIQAQILNLLAELVRKMGLSLIFIAHDLSVVKHISDRVAVMYLGKIVELGEASEIIENPLHPYTKALVSAIPTPTPDKERDRKRIMLPGDPPSPINPPAGCTFHPRCPYATDACKVTVPQLEDFRGREVSCIRKAEI